MQAQSQSQSQSTAKSSSSVFSSLTNNKFVNYIRWLYMQYLLNTALYMLEPFEVRLFNFVMILILVTWAYSTYVFLPSQIMRFIQSFSNDSVQVYIWYICSICLSFSSSSRLISIRRCNNLPKSPLLSSPNYTFNYFKLFNHNYLY